MMKAYKYRLHPNKEQTIFLEKSIAHNAEGTMIGFGLQSQNLISEDINTPVVDGVGGVELLTLVGALKRQYVQM